MDLLVGTVIYWVAEAGNSINNSLAAVHTLSSIYDAGG
jgi:hypothetical protein